MTIWDEIKIPPFCKLFCIFVVAVLPQIYRCTNPIFLMHPRNALRTPGFTKPGSSSHLPSAGGRAPILPSTRVTDGVTHIGLKKHCYELSAVQFL
ncbi:unnamed protein product [Leptidea sinapis]|uniref:Uncharacterized protein n=1 Tax=Leptidea sinapis TaxID=189913 RepID=A0A5E4QS54_9NEOP|nr:unnamed protein product [Leptidea sinapis]